MSDKPVTQSPWPLPVTLEPEVFEKTSSDGSERERSLVLRGVGSQGPVFCQVFLTNELIAEIKKL